MTEYQVHILQESEFESKESCALLNGTRNGDSSNGLVLAQRELPADVLQRACVEFEASDAVVGVLPTASDLKFVWSQLPNPIAALSMPLENRCAVFSKPAADLTDAFVASSHPIWESICRLTINDPSGVTLLTNDSLSTDLAAIDLASQLPSVNPSWPPKNLEWLSNLLHTIDLNQLLPNASSATEVTALQAGLWQLHDFLDESHSAAQSIEGECSGNGDYWHAIMHRREPDYSNGKYWFRRVGKHARFSDVAIIAAQLLTTQTTSASGNWKSRLSGSTWDAFAFVDMCEELAGGGDVELVSLAERIQWSEMLVLLVDSYHEASGFLDRG